MNSSAFIHSITNEFKEIWWDARSTIHKQEGRQLYLDYFSTHATFFNNSVTQSKKIAIQSINIEGNNYFVLFETKHIENQLPIALNLDEIKGDKNSINLTHFSLGNNNIYLINYCSEDKDEQQKNKNKLRKLYRI